MKLWCTRKKSSINSCKAKTNFCLSLNYNCDNSSLFGNGKEIFKFKADNGTVNFPTQFCLAGMSNGFGAIESKEVSLKGNVYNFLVEYNAIDKCNILNIQMYVMVKNNIK